MPRIRCHYEGCVSLESGYCGAEAIQLDPEMGCLTFTQEGESSDEEDWDEEIFEYEEEDEEEDWEDFEDLDEDDLDEDDDSDW
jgi:hypothetical protein